MNTKEQLPNVKLQKTSVIFMQLGLILALFSVYLIIEHESYYKPYALVVPTTIEDPDDVRITEFEVEKPKTQKKTTVNKVVKPIVKQQPKPSNELEVVKDESKKIEDAVFDTTEDDQKKVVKLLNVDDIGYVDGGENLVDDIPFSIVEFAPEFPGCTGTKLEKKACFNKQIKRIVQRNFNVDLAQDLGLREGKQRINVQFIIDTQGNIVDVQVRAPHKRLEKEAKRIVALFPKMKPAKQGTKNARVKFNLPIKFVVED